MRMKKRSAAAVAIGAVLVGLLGAVAQSAAQDGSIAICIVTRSDGTTEAFPCDEDGNRIGEPGSGTTVTTAPVPEPTQAPATTVAPEQATTTTAAQAEPTTTVTAEEPTTSAPTTEGSEDGDSSETPTEAPVAEAVSGEPDYTG